MLSRRNLLAAVIAIAESCAYVNAMIANHNHDEDQDVRAQFKPFYLRDIKIGDNITLPFSPVTVILTFISLLMLSGFFSGKNKVCATASHILLMDNNNNNSSSSNDDDATKTKLLQIKKQIGNDYAKFQEAAKQYSMCPSGKSAGGSLGSFQPGSMVPAFDRVIFAKDSKLHEVIGPIQTNFGWHLIWIEDRTLME